MAVLAPLQRVEPAAQALELVALGVHQMRRRLGDEALVAELGLRARDLRLQALPLGGRLARLGLAVDEVARADLDAAAGHRDGGGRLTLRLEVEPRHARHERRRAVEAVDPRRQTPAGLDARLVAPRALRLDRPDDRRHLGLRGL